MNLYFFDDNEIITFSLPIKRIGDFWMTDREGKNIVNIKAIDNVWYLSSSENTKLIGTTEEKNSLSLVSNTLYTIEKNDKKYILFSSDLEDNTFNTYNISSGTTLKIGSNTSSDIHYNNTLILPLHCTLTFQNNSWKIIKEENAKVYVNNISVVNKEEILKNGDVINIYGNKLVLISNMIFINNLQNCLKINNNLSIIDLIVNDIVEESEIQNDELYKEEDYYLKSPRLRKIIEPLEMKIDSPPSKENIADTPLWVMLAPMLTMAASSVVSVCTSITSITSGERTLKEVLPSLVISIAMIITTCVWPFITKKLEKKAKIKREEERQTKYKKYLDTKKEEIIKEYENQKKILEENLLATNICYDSIINKRRTLWERKKDQGDFLTVRVGQGQIPFNAKINYHIEDFTMDDDNLKKMLDGLIKGYETLENVPIGYSFSENNKTAINGIYPKYVHFMNNMLLQIMSYHSYDDLKIVIFTNKQNQNRWEYLKDMPYCFSDDKMIRFFATSTEEMQEVSNYLETVFNNRKEAMENIGSNNEEKEYSKFNNYYLMIIDDINLARKIKIVDNILEEKRNYGFSTVIIEEKLSKVPSEVTSFLTIGESTSMIMKSENNNQIRFTDEITNYDMGPCSKMLSNLPIYIDNSQKQLPNTITFLEMFGVGQIEQLNVLNRWKENDPTKSLKTEIGVNENGDLFILDLHEKQHGPHGLVAGMTGSGKSEFIISYILSMAVNYSPEEVVFVLIDYKGGGLAGAFVDSKAGEKLPHVVGTITNLDKTEINRALASINSELRRRQEKFNEVRDEQGESTVDIYKYQKMYRDGVVKEPMPHLVIVCDEFAELKTQQPEFMEDLISTARIGRSLGVHLILATQKPSGVVDAQIWSNSKFKICLKVQDKSDSMEMIKNDLAAELKNVGRFYLQVGYNEYFAKGQAAWAGAKYYPSKEFKKPIDKNIYFIDNIGNIKKGISNAARNNIKPEGEELTSIVKYLISIGETTNIKIRQLWLDKIPNQILLNNIIKKYNFIKTPYNINPVIGEYDDPTNQSQGLLTLPLTEEGSAIIYGMPDSGKDEFLQSLVYSTILTYSTSEVNMYLIDYGAETLINFNDAPQVGDVILNGDDEKADNLIKMLMSEISKRKKLFLAYNGNYQDFIKTSKNKIPSIVVLINGMEVLTENNPEYVDKLVPLVREGAKYGIHFVMTASTQSSVKFKISQSCKLQLCLQMNNSNDYRDILGKTDGLVPYNSLGRGLIRLDKVCEFQTVSINEDDKIFDTIKDLINVLNSNKLEKAMRIPVMPNIIKLERFNDKYKDISNIPLGLTKDNLTASLYNFSKNVINLISSSEIENMRNFINNFIKTLDSNNNFDKIVIDSNNFFEEYKFNTKLINSNFNEFINLIKSIDDKYKEILNKNNMNVRSLKNERNILCIIIGIDKFLSKLSDEEKNIFKEILNNNKDSNKINFVFIDVPSSFKKYEFEDWFKNLTNTNEGIFIGGGITQQYVIKLNVQPMGISTIENDYAVVVKNAMPTVIKLINENNIK